jgi:hypothetical protein
MAALVGDNPGFGSLPRLWGRHPVGVRGVPLGFGQPGQGLRACRTPASCVTERQLLLTT